MSPSLPPWKLSSAAQVCDLRRLTTSASEAYRQKTRRRLRGRPREGGTAARQSPGPLGWPTAGCCWSTLVASPWATGSPSPQLTGRQAARGAPSCTACGILDFHLSTITLCWKEKGLQDVEHFRKTVFIGLCLDRFFLFFFLPCSHTSRHQKLRLLPLTNMMTNNINLSALGEDASKICTTATTLRLPNAMQNHWKRHSVSLRAKKINKKWSWLEEMQFSCVFFRLKSCTCNTETIAQVCKCRSFVMGRWSAAHFPMTFNTYLLTATTFQNQLDHFRLDANDQPLTHSHIHTLKWIGSVDSIHGNTTLHGSKWTQLD